MPIKPHHTRELIADMIAKNLENIIPREISIPTNVSKIISILGPRRAGKTSVCLQLIQQLRQSMHANQLLYINFEDDRFYPATLEDMDLLLRTYYSMFPENKSKLVYFFFDEVQEVPGWEKFVRRVWDQENCRVYLTGSSSKLLSREIASSLRGRTLSFEIFPLSFKEFLVFNKIPLGETSKDRAYIKKALEQYFWQGGFPELTFLPKSLHLPTINEYINLMLYRDLTERFNVRNTQLLKYLLKYALTNLSNPLSVNRTYNDLKSQGYQLSKNTVYEYLSYLEEAFILYKTSLWSESIRKTAINPIKIYAVDQSFKYAMTGRSDEGRVLENIVYMSLRRLGHEPSYTLHKQEVDFFFDTKYPINSCYQMHNPETLNREINALKEGMDIYDLKTSYLINMDEERTEKTASGTIEIVPLDKFLLSSSELF